MKHKRSLVILMGMVALVVVAALVAYSPKPAAGESPASPKEASAPPVDLPALEGENGAEPGGVEVALSNITLPDSDAVAVVNGEEVATSAYTAELERALYSVTAQYALDWNDPENLSLLPTFQEQVLDEIIDRTLIHQLAGAEGLSADPQAVEDEIAAIQAEIEVNPTIVDWESFLATNNLTEESLRALIYEDLLVVALAEQHSAAESVQQVKASHILVDTEETGLEVLGKLALGEDFGALAAEYSLDPGSKGQSGDLGWFPRGVMVPEFEDAAFALEPGETSELVETQFGYHIVQVQEKGERELDPELSMQFQQQQFRAWFEARYAEASIDRLIDFRTSQ